MQDFLLEYYFYIQALHVIAVISWMAGLLYLPRLFVYHVDAKAGSELSETLKIMEAKLLRIIMNPAMIAAWVFALIMIYAQPALFQEGWMHAKLTAVIAMTIMHMVFAKWRKDFAADNNQKSQKFYRIWNEVPAVLMVIIVFMAIAKPF